MATTRHRETTVHTVGELPMVGSAAPDFQLVDTNLKVLDLSQFSGMQLILNIFPSIDTSVCAASVREFNKRAASLSNTKVLCISKDLPFAHKRFCAAEGIGNVISLSDFRDPRFGERYGVTLVDGSMAGLLARAIVVVDGSGQVTYTELVPAIGQEPDYEQCINALAAG